MNVKHTITVLFITALAVNLQSQNLLWSKKSNPNSGLATYGVTFSVGGDKILSGSECHPAYIRMFNTATGDLEWSYDLGLDLMCVQGVKFSSNGVFIASVEELGNILIFDNQTGTPTISDTIDTGTSYAFSADFSPSSDRIVVGASSGKMNIYNLPGGSLFKSVSAHNGFVLSVAYSPDGTLIASSGSDNRAKIWAADGTAKFTLTGHTDDVSSVKFSPDNVYLVSGALDGKVKVWNAATGALIRTINAHADEVKQVDISPDGSMIVSASSDQTCKIWNLQTGEQVTVFGESNGGVIWSAAWSPDGSKMATGTSKGDVNLYDMSGVAASVQLPPVFAGAAVFPNPATDWMSLILPEQLRLASLEICDAQGKILRRLDPEQRQWPVSDIPQGIYFLKMTTTEGEVAALRLGIFKP